MDDSQRTRKFGLLGATGIAERAILAPAGGRDDVRVQAVAASNPARAEAYRLKHGLPIAYHDYRELLDDESIDVVYVSLHNSAHAQWAAEAARAGKHVLVEKPWCLSRREAVALRRAAADAGVRVIETVMTAHHPWQTAVSRFIASGELGELCTVTTRISFYIPPGAGYRFRPELGGGALFDTATYWLQAMQATIGLDAVTVEGSSGFTGPHGVDLHFSAALSTSDGVRVGLEASLTGPSRADHEFVFTQGRLRIRNFLLPAAGCLPLNLTIAPDGGRRRVVSFPAVDYYAAQLGRTLAALDEPSGNEEAQADKRVAIMEDAYLSALTTASQTCPRLAPP